jgi:hypothetical protein
MATTWKTHFEVAGPGGGKYKIVKDNLTAAVMSFDQRADAAETPSVGAKRALDIAAEASESTKHPRVEIVD